VLGFIPGVGTVTNLLSAGISVAEGKYGEAGLSVLAAVPLVGVIGEVGKGAKLAEEAAGAVRGGAQSIANASKLAKQLSSEEGAAELLSGGGKAVAGAGTKVPLRDVGRLVSEYGGKPGDWAKITSTAEEHLQTHAYRNVVTGEVVELKSIVP
jgi:hypothetical protein